MDGAADEPLEELGGLTPLAKANIPNVDWISSNGRLGKVCNVPVDFQPGSDIALMSLMGYNPQEYHTGRAPLEAAAMELALAPTDWIFRCNLVTVSNGDMLDYSAGHIETLQAATLINDLNEKLGSDKISFYPGKSYRHIMVYRGDMNISPVAPPHDIMDEPINKYLPRGKNSKELRKLMEKASAILADHEMNKVRSDLGENPATDIWLWGHGTQPKMDSFRSRFGLLGAVITAVDLLRGIGYLIGMKLIDVENATGYLDTNYAGKGQAAIDALKDHDIVVVHIEAPDEAGHGAMIEGKVDAIEQIDKHIVGPVLNYLKDQKEDWRIMTLPDHPTPIHLRTHTSDPVPFAMAGMGVSSPWQYTYNEVNAEKSGLTIKKGHELMEYFLKGQG